jgi:hypothetical protein
VINLKDFTKLRELMEEADNYENEPLAKKMISVLNDIILESEDTEAHLRSVVRDFDECGIDYAIIGGFAVRAHNFVRFTEDIDFLVSKEGMREIHNKLIGKGYTLRPGSNKNLFLITGKGRYPIDILVEGDREGDVSLPNPKSVRMKMFGAWYLTLDELLNFKLRAGRGKDDLDVSQLIELNGLDSFYANRLDADVRDKFLKIISKV